MSDRAPSIGAVVVRVRDLRVMTAFWSAALDYIRRHGRSAASRRIGTGAVDPVHRYPPEDDRVSLKPRRGDGVALSLDLKPSEYGLPPRFHLDLFAEDQAAEVERLVGLGARVIPLRHSGEVDWVLMEDPEGNPHSLGRHAAARRAGTGERGPGFHVIQT